MLSIVSLFRLFRRWRRRSVRKIWRSIICRKLVFLYLIQIKEPSWTMSNWKDRSTLRKNNIKCVEILQLYPTNLTHHCIPSSELISKIQGYSNPERINREIWVLEGRSPGERINCVLIWEKIERKIGRLSLPLTGGWRNRNHLRVEPNIKIVVRLLRCRGLSIKFSKGRAPPIWILKKPSWRNTKTTAPA